MLTHEYPNPELDFDEDAFYRDFEDLKDRVETLIIDPYEAGTPIYKEVEDGKETIIINRVTISTNDWQTFVQLYEDLEPDFEVTWELVCDLPWAKIYKLETN